MSHRLRRTRPFELVAALAVVTGLGLAVPAFSSDAPVGAALAPAPLPAVSPAGTTALAATRKPAADAPPTFLIARPRGRSLALRSRPAGTVVAELAATTEFGSPRRLGVVRRSGRWLAVASAQLPNGRLGWVDERTVVLARTTVSLTLDLSARELVLRRAGRVVRRMTVGVGRPASPTPRGRFAVTDKLPGSRYGPYYGCCIVALSARQPTLPPDWPGGDRIAIHGTNDPSSIGKAGSAGCPHASAADMRRLMEAVPLGAPVFVSD